MEAYARCVDRPEFASTVAIYWNPRERVDQRLALPCVRAAVDSLNLSGAELSNFGLPVLEDALFGDNSPLCSQSIAIFGSSVLFRRGEGRCILQRFVDDPARDERQRSKALALLER